MTEKGAGFLLLKRNAPEVLVLCLRIYSSFDLPKGKIEDGESELEAAVRETYEETNVKDIDMPYGNANVVLANSGKNKKLVVLFVGTTDEEPVIKKNPETNVYEHHGYAWLTLNEAEVKLHDYLRPAIGWLRDVIFQFEKR